MNTSTFQRPVALGRIDYMNVAPVYYGIDNGLVPQGIGQESGQRIRLISGPPNTLNQMMINGVLDISPVSSAAYARNAREWLILPDLAVACNERVLSVLLVSRYRLEALTGRRILITDESSSARDLCSLIFNFKGVRPEFVVGKVKSPSRLKDGIDAALVIGDSALSQQWGRVFPNIYDLGTQWWNLTGLPFVFAVWAVRKDFARKYPEKVEAVLALLKASRKLGNENMKEIIENACAKLDIDVSVARLYFDSLVYQLSEREMQGLELFYKRLYQAGITEGAAPLFFFGSMSQKTADQARLSYIQSPARSVSRGIAGCCPAL
jgi:chorismate dehydratase